MQYHLLTQERAGGRFVPITVTGANSPAAAIDQVATEALIVIGLRDSRESAAREAAQLNAANGIPDTGCATCGN